MEICRYLDPENLGRMLRDCGFLIKTVVESRGELDLHLRDNYFNVYFQGNSLAKVTFLPRDEYKVEIHEKFFRGTLGAKKLAYETGGSLNGYARIRVGHSKLPALLQKTTINQLQANIRKVHYGEELTFEQLLISDNLPTEEFFFIDRQVTYPHLDRKRLDLLALERIEGNRYRFVVIEVKLGNNPDLRDKVAEQLDGYVSHLSGPAFPEYQTCYQLNYHQKRVLGLLPVSHEEIHIENGVRGMVEAHVDRAKILIEGTDQRVEGNSSRDSGETVHLSAQSMIALLSPEAALPSGAPAKQAITPWATTVRQAVRVG